MTLKQSTQYSFLIINSLFPLTSCLYLETQSLIAVKVNYVYIEKIVVKLNAPRMYLNQGDHLQSMSRLFKVGLK